MSDVWLVSENNFPENGDMADKLKFLLRYAILAPSSHNVQPWKFKIDGNKADFYVDFSKSLKIANPDNRELFISTGCAIANFVIAAKHFGFNPKITYSGEGDLAASVLLEPSQKQKNGLFEQITKRHTDRDPYFDKTIPQNDMENLQKCCEGAVVLTLAADKQIKSEIAELVRTGDITQFNDKAYRDELSFWIRKGILGNTGLIAWLISLIMSDFNIGSTIGAGEKKSIETSSAFAILSSDKNERVSWIKTGEVFEKIALTATGLGMCLQPMNQGSIQVPAHREKLKSLLNITGIPNFAFRIGYAEIQNKHTPRHELEYFLN